jgi:hypothetical protein
MASAADDAREGVRVQSSSVVHVENFFLLFRWHSEKLQAIAMQ